MLPPPYEVDRFLCFWFGCTTVVMAIRSWADIGAICIDLLLIRWLLEPGVPCWYYYDELQVLRVGTLGTGYLGLRALMGGTY